MSKKHTLSHELLRELFKLQCLGVSKAQQRIIEHTRNPKEIFGKETSETYKKHCRAFGRWCQAKYNIRKPYKAKKYVKEYLEMKQAQHLSPSSIKTIASALAKVFHVSYTSFGVEFKERKRADIKRSRTVPDPKIEEKAKEVISFIKATGLRRHEVLMVMPEEITEEKDGKMYVFVRQGKGGRKRHALVLPEYQSFIKKLKEGHEEKEPIFKSIPRNVQAHYYRAVYAQSVYQMVARDVASLPRSEKYYMRADRKGEVYDRKAMLFVSRQLGHNRIDVIAGHYLYTAKEIS